MKFLNMCVLFLAIICYQSEHLNIQATNALKMIAKGRGKRKGFEVEQESTEVTLPKDNRCQFIGRFREDSLV